MQLKRDKSTAGGLSFVSVLTLIFIVLKLINVIDWNWCWVLAPMWISFILIFLIVAFVLIYFSIRRKNMSKHYTETRKRIKKDIEKYYTK